MKHILILAIACISLSACGIDGNTSKVADYSGITKDVSFGQDHVKRAVAVAEDIEKNGTHAGSPEIKSLQLELQSAGTSLQAALQDIAVSKANDAANVKKANEAEGKLIAQNAAHEKREKNFPHWIVGALILGVITAHFAPFIKIPLSLYPPLTLEVQAIPNWACVAIAVVLEAVTIELFFKISAFLGWLFRLL